MKAAAIAAASASGSRPISTKPRSANATARSARRRASCICRSLRERLHILSGADDLATYQFNTGTAKHTFCRHCGIHAFYNPRTDPENYSVNARVLDDYDPATMQPRRLFDGRNWEEAAARHQAEWQAKP